ncbi:MAG TPA: hypothetical protein VHW23_40940 [Kofleriaceae bacterium]|nr:hypothetical protein [Kofleriaceae bacterium]
MVSGLGPPGCFVPTPTAPTTQDQFANQCTRAQTLEFDNCTRLQLCSDNALSAAMGTTMPPVPIAPPPPVTTPEPQPTAHCADAGNVIYVTGSTNLPPLIKAVQPLLYAGTPPHTVVFAPQTSCKGAAAIYDPVSTKHLIFDATNNWAFYYDHAGNQTFCLLDPAGNTVDVGESDVYPQSCGYSPTLGIADYTGPIQAITFVVPAGSMQTAISAEAAHLVFGAGGNRNQALPWIDPRLYFIRGSGTGTVQLPSRAIGIDPGAWWGIDRLSADNLVASLEAVDPSQAEGAIGILSSDFADRNRANLRELAFQQHGQKYAYFPDSTSETLDKANVRDGHYPIWGAIHFMAATDNAVPSETARALITQFTLPKLDQALVSAIIDAGFVPPCAMTVTHTSELGPLTAFQPEFGCGCLYDKKVANATSCQSCTASADCTGSAKVCNYGFCEVQ